MRRMWPQLAPLLLHWGIRIVSVWIAGQVFRGIRFANFSAVLATGLLLAVANAVVRPLVIVLTLPLTVLTLGVFLLVINAGILLLVSRLVKGFTCDGFWTALWASMLIGFLSMVFDAWLNSASVAAVDTLPHSGLWL